MLPSGIISTKMKTGSERWMFQRADDQAADGRANEIHRLAIEAAAEVCLENIIELTNDEEILYYAANARYALNCLYDTEEAVIARHEARGSWDPFRLLHRQLAGYALEFTALAGKKPEQPCNQFKARQLNAILRPLKEQMEEDMGVPLCLVSEEGEHTYSDVSLILRNYLDVGASYVHRHYNGNPPVIPPVPSDWATSLVQDQILLFCMDRPRSMMEIGNLLGFKDKKTIRKYLNPLLDEGLISRTVPDKPNSRNQKYFTARNL